MAALKSSRLYKLILGAFTAPYKAFTMKDIKDAKATAEQQKHVTVINWMKENNFKYIGCNLYIYKTFTIKTKHPIIQPVETNEILSWRIGDFNIFEDYYTDMPKMGWEIGCIDVQTNRLCIETLISIIDLLS